MGFELGKGDKWHACTTLEMGVDNVVLPKNRQLRIAEEIHLEKSAGDVRREAVWHDLVSTVFVRTESSFSLTSSAPGSSCARK